VAHEQVTVEGAAHSFDFHPVQRDLLPRVLAFLAERLA
jgi:hypothetical protein